MPFSMFLWVVHSRFSFVLLWFVSFDGVLNTGKTTTKFKLIEYENFRLQYRVLVSCFKEKEWIKSMFFFQMKRKWFMQKMLQNIFSHGSWRRIALCVSLLCDDVFDGVQCDMNDANHSRLMTCDERSWHKMRFK